MSSPKLIGSKPDILIAGAGVIGLSVALELQARGARVAIVEQAARQERTVGQASWAAAGMLAAEDPYNPPGLRDISRLSRGLYEAFLSRIAFISGQEVPFQTHRTVQYESGVPVQLEEESVDPRQLMSALEQAADNAGIPVQRGFQVAQVSADFRGVKVVDPAGETVAADRLVLANGAWCGAIEGAGPRKGQMLRLRLTPEAAGDTVHRSEEIYVVPRTAGPYAGTALVGATVEDVGFDTRVEPAALEALRERAARLSPALGWVREAELLESWCGFRPWSPTELPTIGALGSSGREFVATGHFRNGILLAPATAVLLADIMEGKLPAIATEPFAPRQSGTRATNRTA